MERVRRFWSTLLTTILTSFLILALIGCRASTPQATTVTPRSTDTPVVSVVEPLIPTFTPTPVPSSTPTPTASPTAHRSPLSPEERAALEAITSEVEQLRELDSDAPLALTFMTPDELHDWLVEELAEDYSPEEARRDAQTYAVLELLPPETDLYAVTLALYTEQVAGFYDNDVDKMTIIDDKTGLDALDKIVFAHEYTHDLQDRFLGLDDLQTFRKTAEDEDQIRAVTALVEGDAQTVTLMYLFKHLDELDPSALDTIQTDVLDTAPLVLREELTFPYMAGMAFAQTIRQQGGWHAVNAAFNDPPQSTEQILHPEKYLAGEAPISVPLPPLTATLGTGWQLVKENTLGEFLINLYLSARLPHKVAKGASAGWGGDRFALYERPANNEILLLIVTTWDDEAEAAEFVSAYTAFAQDKYAGPASTEDEWGSWWQGNSDVTLLSPAHRRVIVIVGSEVDTIRRVWEVLKNTEKT